MEVWVVYSGCMYAGGSINAIFDSEQKAIWWVKNYTRKYNLRERHRYNPRNKWCYWKQRDENGNETKKPDRPSEYRRLKHDPNSWERELDYMSVRPWKVN